MQSLLKKKCPRCGKVFFTYDEAIKYCNTDCEARHKYYLHFKHQDPIKKSTLKECQYCKDMTPYKNFCCEDCRRKFHKQKKLEKNIEVFLRDKTMGRRVSYEELNRRAEYARVFDDNKDIYRSNRNKI